MERENAASEADALLVIEKLAPSIQQAHQAGYRQRESEESLARDRECPRRQ